MVVERNLAVSADRSQVGGVWPRRARRIDRQVARGARIDRRHIEHGSRGSSRRHPAPSGNLQGHGSVVTKRSRRRGSGSVAGIENSTGLKRVIRVLWNWRRALVRGAARVRPGIICPRTEDHRHVIEGPVRSLERRLRNPLLPEPGIVDEQVVVGNADDRHGMLVRTAELHQVAIPCTVVGDLMPLPIESNPGDDRMAGHHRLVNRGRLDPLTVLDNHTTVSLRGFYHRTVIGAVSG